MQQRRRALGFVPKNVGRLDLPMPLSELSLFQRICLLVLTPLALASLAVTVTQQMSGQLGFVYLTVYAPESAEEFPVVRSILSERVTERSGLQPGDVLKTAAGRSLAGTGPITFYAAIVQTSPEERPIALDFERDGKPMSTLLDVSPRSWAREHAALVYGLLMIAVAVVILVRAPRSRISLPIYVVMTAHAINYLWFPGGPPALTYAWVAAYALSEALFAPMFVLLFMVWLDRNLPRWAFWLPWIFVLKAFLRLNSVHEAWLPAEPSLSAFVALDTIMIVSAGAFAVATYRTGDALERRKLRWVGYGLVVALVPMITLNLAISLRPEWVGIRTLGVFGLVAIPLGLLMAIVRYDWLDIDRIIGGTASAVLIGLAQVGFDLGAVPVIAERMEAVAGREISSAEPALTIVTALFIIPGYRLLRPRIEALFFREREALQAGVESLVDEFATCDRPGAIVQLAGDRLDSLLHPKSITIHSASLETLAPVFGRGPDVAVEIDRERRLVADVIRRRAAISTRELGDATSGPSIDAETLVALDAHVVLPVLTGRTLQYLVCLGGKESGDIYTATDLSLLDRVAEAISSELLRFEESEVVGDDRAMHAALLSAPPVAADDPQPWPA
jgi:hypothetical protein